MKDEEIAENYAKGLCKTCTFDTCRHNALQTYAIKESLKQAYLDGLTEGRKEGYEQGKNNERESQCGKKNYEKDIARLEKENAELDCQMNRNKYCYSCVNATDRCFRNEIGCPCEKYKSYKDENAERYKTKWHYPSKGEYPKEGENVLCYCKCRTEIKFCCVGHIVAGGDNKIRWWSSNRSEELNVIAWKEIILPKEVEEND